MSQQKAIFNYDDEGHVDKLSRKAKDAPFMILGLFNFFINYFVLNLT